MLEAVLWGLIQGLTEFLPISSSGHLVLVPTLAGLDPPDLSVSALLHLGTLTAVVAYYRKDLISLTQIRTNPRARRVLWLLLLGTLPAVAGILVRDLVGDLQESLFAVGIGLFFTGVVLLGSSRLAGASRTLEDASAFDAILVGLAQAVALIPGISRSGMTITAGMGRQLEGVEAARFSFLLAVPAIAGAALLEGLQLASADGVRAEVWLGVAIAAVSGYWAIGFLVRAIARVGLVPFGFYCLAAGAVAVFLG